MPYPKFDRSRLIVKSLKERKNQIGIEKKQIPLKYRPSDLTDDNRKLIRLTAGKIINARKKNRSVILSFGAHTIKNGLGPLLIELIKNGWVTHLATNGAGIIHDWEFAFQGKSGEDVRENVKNGQFGIWEETGLYINLSLIAGAFEKLGYGESVGKMVSNEGISIPDKKFLLNEIRNNIECDPEYSAAALDFYNTIKKLKLDAGFISIPHPFKKYSVQCAAYDLNIPFTGHPMIGHDIIYTHHVNNGAAIGRTALNDFLSFADSVSNLENGVYMSIGSAVMSPMVFEKSLSMAQNIEIQGDNHIDNQFIVVVDIAKNEWDWNKMGEPPADNPAYYLRYCKTFNRMGGEMHYMSADNRDFLSELYHDLSQKDLTEII
jgi:hypothetical protein